MTEKSCISTQRDDAKAVSGCKCTGVTRSEIDDYIWQKRQMDRWYSPYTDKALMAVAQQVVMDNMEAFDIANKGKNPDQNISEDDFKAVAQNKNSQYNELQIWAAKLLLSNDTKVSEEDREKVFAGEADPAAYGWKLWSWKKSKSWWDKAVDFVVQVVKIGVGFLPYADCLSAGLSLVQGNGVDAMDAAGCAADLLTGGVGGRVARVASRVADGARATDGARAADAVVHSDELFGASDEIADMAKMGDSATNTRLTNGTQFETLSEAPITGTTRSAHRASANRSLAGQLEADDAFRQSVDNMLGTDTLAHMRSGKGGLKNPPGTTWHHPPGSADRMILIRKEVHRMPELQPTLHPGPNGGGGFAEFFG